MQPQGPAKRFGCVTRKPILSDLCGVAGAALLGACAASGKPVQDVIVTHYTPSPIIVATRNSGVFRPAEGCVLFIYGTERSWRAAALFPPGTRVADDKRSLLLPNGQAIPFGTELTVIYEAPPEDPDHQLCGLRTIQVLHLQTR